MNELLSLLARLFDDRVAVGYPEHFTTYLASIPFVNGDGWEVVR